MPKFARIKEEGRYTNQIVSVLDNMVGVQKVSVDKDSNELTYAEPIAINKDDIEKTTEFDGEEGQAYLKDILKNEMTVVYGGARKSRKARNSRKARKTRKAKKTQKAKKARKTRKH
jgi:hypothetical protein